MRRTLYGILAAAAVGLATAPASAQWGPPAGGYGGPPGGYGGGYGRDFDEEERPRYRRRDFDRERPRYRRDPGYGQGNVHGGRPRMGSICVTPRGPCAVGSLAPSGSSCGCPVFGARGVIN